MKITFVIEEWSQSTKGGRSTFMRQMAIVLSKLENVEICILIPCASPEDREDAQKYNIKVFEAKKYPGYEPVDCLLFLPEGFSSDYIICYGIKPGRCGQVLKDTYGCKWVHVVLRNAEETAWYQKTSVAIFKGQEQHEIEVELCKNADMVITVGSQLEKSFISALRQCKKDHIFNLTPGIFDESFFEQKQHRNSKNFEILVFGRGNAEDFEHEGLHVAAKAVALANKHEPSYILKVVGAPEGEQEKLTERLEGLEIPRGHLIVKSFDEERTKLGQLFSKVDLVLMPSGTGAFGLTALEALSAEVPILITHNSGLADALQEVPLGNGCIVHVGQTVGQAAEAAEAAEWAEQIKKVKEHRKTRLEGARMLRNNYKEKYSWMDQCAAFVKKLRALHSGNAEEMQQESQGKRHSARKRVAGHAEEMQQESQGKRSSPRKRVAGHTVEMQQESQGKRSSSRKRVAGHAVEMQQESQGKRRSSRKRVTGDAEEMQQEFQSKRGSLRKQMAGHAKEMEQESQGKRSSPRKKVAGHTEEMQQESQGKRSSPRKRLAEGVVTDDDIETLGKAIGSKWAQLARRLLIKREDIEGIDDRFKDLADKGFHILELWKSNNGEAADYKTLYDGLSHNMVQRKDLAEKYCFK